MYNRDIEFYNLYISFQAYKVLKQCKSDEEMFDKMLEVIGNTPFEEDDLKIAGYLLFKKLAAATLYYPDKKIEGPVTLIKATENFIPIAEDHNLSQVRDLFVFPFLLNLYNIVNIIFLFPLQISFNYEFIINFKKEFKNFNLNSFYQIYSVFLCYIYYIIIRKIENWEYLSINIYRIVTSN